MQEQGAVQTRPNCLSRGKARAAGNLLEDTRPIAEIITPIDDLQSFRSLRHDQHLLNRAQLCCDGWAVMFHGAVSQVASVKNPPLKYWFPKACLWRSLKQSLNLACFTGHFIGQGL